MNKTCGYSETTKRCNKQSKKHYDYCSINKTRRCALSTKGKQHKQGTKLSPKQGTKQGTQKHKTPLCKGLTKDQCLPPPCAYVNTAKRNYCKTRKQKSIVAELDTVGLEIQATIKDIEQFVTKKYSTIPEQNRLRALIICFSDRYGAGKVLSSLSKFNPPNFTTTEKKQLYTLILESKKWNKKLRTSLATRTDKERVQMQRPIHGKSLLALVVPYNPTYGEALNGLLVTSFHPKYGIEELKHTYAQYQSLPFKLPAKLQPEIPKLERTDTVDATNINQMIKDIYLARKGKTPEKYKTVTTFVKTLGLSDDDVWKKFGDLPDEYNKSCQFKCEVPEVKPGKQVILWKTWHTTTGYAPSCNFTGFIDVVPIHFLSPGELLWYNYWCHSAPCDPGGGQARGTWQMMTYYMRQNRLYYGLEPDIMKNWIKHPKKSALTASQMASFHNKGYLVIDIPERLQSESDVANILDNNNDFFRTITGDIHFDFTKLDSIQRSENMAKANQFTGSKYTYYVDKIDENDPLNPNATSGKSHNAQKGGKLIAADSGMGPATFTNEPNFVAFEFSDFVANIMASFYGTVKMVPVLERFRVKSKSQWKSGTHVDIVGGTLIPEDIHGQFTALDHLNMD
tara:strand:+ start:3528 stop:5396 length:1869 start_codon:yes stop_codon:yes gene_type:complete